MNDSQTNDSKKYHFQCQQHYNCLLLIADGKLIYSDPIHWEEGLKISKAIHTVSKFAEEFENAHKIIDDGALLLRAGVPIGLTNNPKMQDEIAIEAAWNRDLRRYIRPMQGIKSEEMFGVPEIINVGDLTPQEYISYLENKIHNMKKSLAEGKNGN